MKQMIAALSLCLLTLGCQPKPVSLSDYQIIDLTYPFEQNTIYWPTEEGFVLEKLFAGTTDRGYYYTANQFRAAEHGGTHLDAPIHFAEGKHTVDQVPLTQLIGPGYVVDVSNSVVNNPDHQISVEDLLAWEKRHGRIPDGSILLLRTGYGRYWPDRRRYLGTNQRGKAAIRQLHFPGLAPAAAQWLLENRKLKAVGIDTPSIDYGQSKLFQTHQILFTQNVPVFENVAHLDQLPLQGFNIIALPMKIANGSGAPLRIIALLPQ